MRSYLEIFALFAAVIEYAYSIPHSMSIGHLATHRIPPADSSGGLSLLDGLEFSVVLTGLKKKGIRKLCAMADLVINRTNLELGGAPFVRRFVVPDPDTRRGNWFLPTIGRTDGWRRVWLRSRNCSVLKMTKMPTGTTRPCYSTTRRYGANTGVIYTALLDVEKTRCDAVVIGRQLDVVCRA